MIVARLPDPAAKLATARRLDPATASHSLGEVLGPGSVTARELYATPDWRGSRCGRPGARRHPSPGDVVARRRLPGQRQLFGPLVRDGASLARHASSCTGSVAAETVQNLMVFETCPKAGHKRQPLVVAMSQKPCPFQAAAIPIASQTTNSCEVSITRVTGPGPAPNLMSGAGSAIIRRAQPPRRWEMRVCKEPCSPNWPRGCTGSAPSACCRQMAGMRFEAVDNGLAKPVRRLV